ncbi:plant/protein [Wolffia australiana]
MASAPLLSFRPATLRTFAAPGDSRSGRKPSRGGAAGGSWWSPLFGWSSEADYIDGSDGGAAGDAAEKASSFGTTETRKNAARRVAFTDDKARRLRMMTAENSAFHDIMYHSAIASRLASDFSSLSED